MKTCEYAGPSFPEPRSHPWTASTTDPVAHLHDFRASPELIRSSLEDFVPWARYSAIETFYALLTRLNHPRSGLETNDCAFTGPHANDELGIAKPLVCSGRLMLLFHALARNARLDQLESLAYALHVALNQSDAAFAWGLVGTTIVPTRYLDLPTVAEQQNGNQLLVSFWAWGDTEADTMTNLGRLFTNLSRALRTVSASV